MLFHFLSWRNQQPGIPLHYIVLRPDLDTTCGRARSRTEADALTDLAPLSTMWSYFADLGALEPHVIDTTALDLTETVVEVAGVIDARSHLLATTADQLGSDAR